MESHSVKFFFVNTDSKHLESECPTKSDIVEKFILGEQIKNGKGAGNNPVIAHDAAVDSSDYFNDIFTISDVVFLLAGFGGGTGTGISMFLTREDFLNNYQDTIVIPIVTLPFAMEGKRRAKNAAMALETVANASAYCLLDPGDRKDKTGIYHPECGVSALNFRKAFKFIDETATNYILGILDMYRQAGFINIDIEDIASQLNGNRRLFLNSVRIKEVNVEEAVRLVKLSPLLGTTLQDCDAVLVDFKMYGEMKLSIENIEDIIEALKADSSIEEDIIYGITQFEATEEDKHLRIFVMASANSDFNSNLDYVEKKESNNEFIKKNKTNRRVSLDGDEPPGNSGNSMFVDNRISYDVLENEPAIRRREPTTYSKYRRGRK